MTLGDILKKYREDNHISMDDFSKKSTLSKGYISMLENNINPRNNKPIAPTLPTIQKIALGMNIDTDSLLKLLDNKQKISLENKPIVKKGIPIKVLGRVAAGIPIDAIEEILDYEEISEDMAASGEYFALKIQGDSMQPRIWEDDIVIVKQQNDVENGDIAIVLVNGDDATCKKIKKRDDGIMLISNNPEYEPMFFTNQQVQDLPVTIIGRVVELRGKF